MSNSEAETRTETAAEAAQQTATASEITATKPPPEDRPTIDPTAAARRQGRRVSSGPLFDGHKHRQAKRDRIPTKQIRAIQAERRSHNLNRPGHEQMSTKPRQILREIRLAEAVGYDARTAKYIDAAT